MSSLFELVVTHLQDNTPSNDLVELHNEICNPDDYIFCSLDDIADTLGDTPAEFASRIIYGNVYSPNDHWFWLNDYDNVESTNSVNDLPIELDDIANYIIDEDLFDVIGVDPDIDIDDDDDDE